MIGTNDEADIVMTLPEDKQLTDELYCTTPADSTVHMRMSDPTKRVYKCIFNY